MIRMLAAHTVLLRPVSAALWLLIWFSAGCNSADQVTEASPTFLDGIEAVKPTALNEEKFATNASIEASRTRTSTAEPPHTPEGIEKVSPTAASGIELDGESRGGVLRLEFGGFFVPDPVVVSDEESALFHAEMYSGLTRIVDRSDGSAVETDLAETYSVRDDGLVYEFVLRQNLKFSDGSTVTAADFKWSWERALNPDSHSDSARHVLGDIKGADSILDGSSQELAGVSIIDDRTFIVELEAPHADFPALMADPVASVLKRENLERWGFDWSRWYQPMSLAPYMFDELPVGTGPFKLVKFEPFEGEVVLQRNEHYWEGTAQLERVEFTLHGISETGSDSDLLFRQGRIDITHSDPNEAELVESREITVYGDLKSPESTRKVEFLAFNTALKPFDDLHFRIALASASDTEASFPSLPDNSEDRTVVIDSRVGGSTLERAYGLVPPDVPGFEKSISSLAHDPERAINELAESVYRDELEQISLRYFTTSVEFDDVLVLADQWSSLLGVEVQPEEIEYVNYLDRLRSGNLQMIRKSVTPRYPAPHAVLWVFDEMFGENHLSPESIDLSRMLDAASTETDAALRLGMYQEIERYILENALAVPMFWSDGYEYVRVQPWVNNYNPPKYHGSRFKDVWIDTSHPDYPSDR